MTDSDSTPNWQAAYFDTMTDALVTLDAESGIVVGFNPAAARLLGHEHDTLTGVHFSSLLPPQTANPNTPLGRRFPLTGEVAEAQLFRHADGYDIPCDVLVTALRGGRSELAVLHLRDARTREGIRQARLETDRAELDAAKSEDLVRVIEQYMSHVSHEVRTPLAVILSSSSMLERYYSRLSEAKREEHFARIQIQVHYLTEFLDNLRFLSRLDAGHVTVRRDNIDAAALLQEMLAELGAHPHQPYFDVGADGEIEALTIDGGLWRRALLPIIQNAVKYGPAGGTVHIRIARQFDALEARVSDHGPGLPAEYLKAAFEVFRRGANAQDTQGGGMGLAIASRCAVLMGGTLTFETQTGAGTTFTLTIPIE